MFAHKEVIQGEKERGGLPDIDKALRLIQRLFFKSDLEGLRGISVKSAVQFMHHIMYASRLKSCMGDGCYVPITTIIAHSLMGDYSPTYV